MPWTVLDSYIVANGITSTNARLSNRVYRAPKVIAVVTFCSSSEWSSRSNGVGDSRICEVQDAAGGCSCRLPGDVVHDHDSESCRRVGHVAARDTYFKGDYSIAEGTVVNFHPLPYSGHQNETFSVNGVEFSYRQRYRSLFQQYRFSRWPDTRRSACAYRVFR